MSMLPKWSFTFRDRDTDAIPTRRLGDRPIYNVDVSDASFVEALARARRLVADQTHLVSGYSLYCVGASAENVAASEVKTEYRERRVRSSSLTSAHHGAVALLADESRWVRCDGGWRKLGKNGKPLRNVAVRTCQDLCVHGLVKLESTP